MCESGFLGGESQVVLGLCTRASRITASVVFRAESVAAKESHVEWLLRAEVASGWGALPWPKRRVIWVSSAFR